MRMSNTKLDSEAHHRNYPYSKESTTTNAFKLARERSVA